MTLMKLPLAKTSFVSLLAMNSSYNSLCLLDNLHSTTCSYFFGNCLSTSAFNLLRRKGRKTFETQECRQKLEQQLVNYPYIYVYIIICLKKKKSRVCGLVIVFAKLQGLRIEHLIFCSRRFSTTR